MASSFEKYQKRRLISSYFSVVMSIALVLFLLGLLGLLVLNTKKVADYFKETISVGVYSLWQTIRSLSTFCLKKMLPKLLVKT